MKNEGAASITTLMKEEIKFDNWLLIILSALLKNVNRDEMHCQFL